MVSSWWAAQEGGMYKLISRVLSWDKCNQTQSIKSGLAVGTVTRAWEMELEIQTTTPPPFLSGRSARWNVRLLTAHKLSGMPSCNQDSVIHTMSTHRRISSSLLRQERTFALRIVGRTTARTRSYFRLTDALVMPLMISLPERTKAVSPTWSFVHK